LARAPVAASYRKGATSRKGWRGKSAFAFYPRPLVRTFLGTERPRLGVKRPKEFPRNWSRGLAGEASIIGADDASAALLLPRTRVQAPYPADRCDEFLDIVSLITEGGTKRSSSPLSRPCNASPDGSQEAGPARKRTCRFPVHALPLVSRRSEAGWPAKGLGSIDAVEDPGFVLRTSRQIGSLCVPRTFHTSFRREAAVLFLSAGGRRHLATRPAVRKPPTSDSSVTRWQLLGDASEVSKRSWML
jgi:hypothetical protein